MTCRHCVEAADLFNAAVARREMKRYRKRGPTASSRLLLEALGDEGALSGHLLDIGGGVGALQHEFLAAGDGTVTGVDASPSYQAAALEEAERRGTRGRMAILTGDAVELGEELPDADVVTLDRVICCYPDMPALVAVSAARAGKAWGVVFPRERWAVRLGVGTINLFQRLRRKRFRVYLHGRDRIAAEAARHGLVPARSARTFFWEVRVFRRSGPRPD